MGPLKKSQEAAAKLGKAYKGWARLLCFSGEAKPGPAIGQALGPLGVNMADFCKQFNAATAHLKPGLPTPCKLTSYADRTFSFELKQPPTTWFLKKAANLERASPKAQREMVGKITLKQVYEIAQIKLRDHPHVPIIGMCRMIAGSAKSMGIDVVDGRDVIPEEGKPASIKFAKKGRSAKKLESY